MRSPHSPTRLLGLALGLLCSSSFACSSAMLADMSAAPTACPAERIEISDARQPWQGPRSWTATCAPDGEGTEQRWFCSQLASEVFCSDIPAGAPAPAQPSPEAP